MNNLDFMDNLGFEITFHEEIFHLIQHEIRIKHKGTEYIVRTTTSGNDFEVRFKDGQDWRAPREDDEVEQRIFKMLDEGEYYVGDSIARY
tara:strand:+ start:276 stop:545 length:270 start_codon:yes stop_codon:yes gene_type:complete